MLRHRYTFATDATDTVGGANGELVGDASIENGTVVLTGNKPSYVNLPNDLFTNFTDVTFEIWVTWKGGGVWQRIWDFGNNNQPEEDMQGEATFSQCVFLTPDNGGGMVLSIFPNGIANQQVVSGPALSANIRHHIVWSYSTAAQTARLFVNGKQEGINTAMTYSLASLGPTVNNWLGHSQYVWDADFAGSIDEFRVYSGTFLDADVSGHLDAGPDMLPIETASRRLRISTSASGLDISWPIGSTNFTLESSPALGPDANWGVVPGTPIEINGEKRVTIDAAGTARFYRLKN